MSAVQYVRHPRATARRRPRRLIAALAGAGLLLAGCASEPGAGAVVDGHSIPEQTVQSRTEAVIAENVPAGSAGTIGSSTRSLLNRGQATDVVRHQLVLSAAKDERIVVTDEQINAFIGQNGGAKTIAGQLTIPTDAMHDAIYDYLVLEKLLDTIPASGVDVSDILVTVDVVPADTRDAAVAARSKYLNDPAAMAADAAAAKAANPQLPGGQESLLANPGDAAAGIFSVPEGEIMLVSQGTNGYYVVRVTKRTTQPAKLTKQTVRSASDLDGHLELASLLLSQYPAADHVTVNPRFGVWDPQTLQVVVGNNGL